MDGLDIFLVLSRHAHMLQILSQILGRLRRTGHDDAAVPLLQKGIQIRFQQFQVPVPAGIL